MTRRLILGLVLAATMFGLAPEVGAQEVGVVRCYLVPRVGSGVKGDPYRAKYTMADELGAGWQLGPTQMIDYGTEGIYIIVVNVTPEQHTTLAAQTDVMTTPSPMDDNVSAVALTGIQNQLEAMHLPGSWVTTSQTYRQVWRTTIKITLFAGRYYGMFPDFKIFDTGVTLDTRFNQLTQAQRQRLLDVADSFQIDRSGVTGTMTIRQLLRALGDQLPAVTILGEVFN